MSRPVNIRKKRNVGPYGERKPQRARKEFIALGAAPAFLDYLAQWFKVRIKPRITSKYPTDKSWRQLAASAAYHQQQLEKLNLKPSNFREENLRELGGKTNLGFLLVPDGKGGYQLPADFGKRQWRFNNERLSRRISKGFNTHEHTELYYLLPSLVLYTKLLTGKPKWALIRRWMHGSLRERVPERLDNWWRHNIATLTANTYNGLGPILRPAIKYSVFAYLGWATGVPYDSFGPARSMEEKRQKYLKLGERDLRVVHQSYVKAILESFPFLRDNLKRWQTKKPKGRLP